MDVQVEWILHGLSSWKHAAKLCTRSHHEHDQSDMIIGATFETNEQNIFATCSIGLHFLL
jgi:hypothetical protein